MTNTINLQSIKSKFSFNNTLVASKKEGVVPCLNFCIPAISQALAGGLRKSSINIIAANSGHGKSWLATNQAVTVAKAGKYVLIISTELGKTEMLARIISIITKIDISYIDQINEKRFNLLGKIINSLASPDKYSLDMIKELDPYNLLKLNQLLNAEDIFESYQQTYRYVSKYLFIIYDTKIEDMFENIILLSSELESQKESLDLIVIDHCDFMSSKDRTLNRDELSRDVYFLERLFEIVRKYKLTALAVKQMSKPVNKIADVNSSESDLIRGTRHWQYLSSAIFLLLETQEQKEENCNMRDNIKHITLCLGKRRQLGGICFDMNGKFVEDVNSHAISKKVYGKSHNISYKQSTGQFLYISPAQKN